MKQSAFYDSHSALGRFRFWRPLSTVLLWAQLQKLEVIKGDAYPNTVIELCSVYVENNQSARAIEILKQVRGRSQELRDHQANNGYTAIDFMLVQLLMASGETKEAKLVADEAAAEMPKRLSSLDCLLVAKCAEAEGDFAQAGKYYAMGPWTSTPSEFATYSPDKDTRKALECAIKAPSYDKVELSKCMCALLRELTNKVKKRWNCISEQLIFFQIRTHKSQC